MKSSPFGIFEIFYGAIWSAQERNSYAEFLRELGLSFYVYGPKMDDCLRKNWRRIPTLQEMNSYRAMRENFAKQGLRFGIILSPQGLDQGDDPVSALKEKVKVLSDLGLDMLGIFFDDMKSAPDMAERQLEMVHAAQATATGCKILFCPSYYSNDSLLDMFFGDRPVGYLETIGQRLSPDIEVVWTGEQIISPEISGQHLREVSEILRRKPFVCDNFFANDGPINCSFLRILPTTGRSPEAFAEACGWGLNPMNQPALSKIVLRSFAHYAIQGVFSEEAFHEAIRAMVPPNSAKFILSNFKKFAEDGLAALSEPEKAFLLHQLSTSEGLVEREVANWLKGAYVIDLLAMLDQSGFETL